MALSAMTELDPKPASPRDFRDLDVRLPDDFVLESGEALSDPVMRMRLQGDLSLPTVLIAGGISSGKQVAGADEAEGSQGWWSRIVHPGGGVDLNAFSVVSFDFLPGPEETARTLSTHDQARAFAYALTEAGIEKLDAFIGVSYGGMTGLAFAELFPERLRHMCIVSAAHRAHPMTTAQRGVQRRILQFGLDTGNEAEGVSLARQLAMTTYRTTEEFGKRFKPEPNGPNAGDTYDVCEYLISRGEIYHAQMPAQRFITMSDAMDRHRVDPAKITTPAVYVAVMADRLVPIEDMQDLNERTAGPSKLITFASKYGHDSFLVEFDKMNEILSGFTKDIVA